MRKLRYLFLAIIFLPGSLYAGQIYGYITSPDTVHVRAAIKVYCPGDLNDKPSGEGRTAPDGSYQINVSKKGECRMELPDVPGQPSTTVFSFSKPAMFNFELRRQDGIYVFAGR